MTMYHRESSFREYMNDVLFEQALYRQTEPTTKIFQYTNEVASLVTPIWSSYINACDIKTQVIKGVTN